MIGDFLRSSGKHLATGAINKGAKHYGKANKKVALAAKRKFKAIATKREREASKARAVKRQKQSRQLKRIK